MSRKKSTRQLIGIDDIKNGSVVTADGELAFYFVHPSNLNVLPEQGVRAKVQELLGVLKGMAELELLALDSKESFQDNRQFYRQRLEEEDMPAIRGLLVQDRQHLDSVQTTMASSREFCFVLRRRKTDGTMNYASLEQQFRDCGLVVQRAEGQRLLELLAIRGSVDVQPVGEAVSARHIPANVVMRLLHHMGQIFRTSMPVIPPALRIDSKRRRRLQEKRMAMGHKRNDHEDEQLHHVNDNTMR